MGNTKKSKTALVGYLGILEPVSVQCITLLGSIRNKLAHGIHHLDFNLDKYLSNLTPDFQNEIAGKLGSLMPDIGMPEMLKREPKRAFAAAVIFLLSAIEQKAAELRLNP